MATILLFIEWALKIEKLPTLDYPNEIEKHLINERSTGSSFKFSKDALFDDSSLDEVTIEIKEPKLLYINDSQILIKICELISRFCINNMDYLLLQAVCLFRFLRAQMTFMQFLNMTIKAQMYCTYSQMSA